MSSNNIQQISIPTLYRQVNHITDHGISGYNIVKKYQDPIEQIKTREFASGGGSKIKKHQIKRGNYLDDETSLHKIVPGPGKYETPMIWPKKSKSLHKPVERHTFIQQLIRHQKREKKPAPGHYKTFKSQKEIQADKKQMASRKIKVQDRMTYLDNIQYESTLTPGVGVYNPHKRINTEGSKLRTNPEEWKKKHQKQAKKKPQKLPDMGTYNPLPSYSLFDSINKVKTTNKNLLGRVERFKTQSSGSGLGPGKYSILQQWRGKDLKKIDKHGFETLAKGISKSVYYH